MDVGLGSERKYGLDREDSPSKRSDKIDDVLDKLDDHLKDGISRGALVNKNWTQILNITSV